MNLRNRLPKVILLFSYAFVFSAFSAYAQSTVSGKITDEKGTALAGVTVAAMNAGSSTSSSAAGTYTISGVSPTDSLIFTSVGYTRESVAVNNRTVINVRMTAEAGQLTDVIVIGYGTQRRTNVTGSIAKFNAENLDERPVTRVDQALVGQLAGVTVKQTSGTPGKAFSIQVRGTGSISAGSEPLYVLDGFPLATASANGSGNFATGNPLDNINPNDIESIQVLKDAASAAIYGSRAANGVVLITTKRGKPGKPKIGFNTYVGYTEASRKLDVLSGEEWVERAIEVINAQWVASGPGRTASQTTAQRLALNNGNFNANFIIDDRWLQPGHPGLRYIDWQDEAFRKGLTQNHQLTASGGNEFVRYYISGNYVNQQGFVLGMDYTSYNARANVEVMASKKLKFGLNIAPTYSVTNDPGVEGKDNILHQLATLTPVQEDTMGLDVNVGKNGQYRWSVSPNSPIAKLKNVLGRTNRFRTITSIFLDYEILKGLTYRSSINYDNIDNNTNSYTPFTVQGALTARIANPGLATTATYTNYRKQTFVNENTLSYSKTIKGDHDLSLLAGHAYNSSRLDNVRIQSQNGFNSNVIQTLNAAAAVTGNTTGTKNVLISYFGRLQYAFKNKYLLSSSYRRDGSSRFGENTKWGVFPSVSLGWRISEEEFMRSISWLRELKLRGSWGKSGNYNIGDYSGIPTIGFSNYTFGGSSAVGQAPNRISNPDVTWEKSETIDFGFDFGIINNRITGSFDYYNRISKDLLLNVPVPQATGFSTALTNVGRVRNKGWEVELSSRNTTKGVIWNTSINFSHNRNRIEALGPNQTQILIPSAFDISHSILKVGEQMNSIYVVRQIGILSAEDIAKGAARFGNQTVGDPKYQDANNDGIIDANDRVIVGHPNPDYTFGITNNIRYKGFDLSVLVQGQVGGSIYSLFGRAIDRTGMGYLENTLGVHRDRWRSEENPGAGVRGKAYSTFGRIKNTDWLYSSDYWRVRNITLGYNLGGLFKVNQIQSARIYLTAENFFGRDKYTGGFNPEAANTDLSGNGNFPEAGDYGGLPLPKGLILGLNVTF